jgi:hypothetical protein
MKVKLKNLSVATPSMRMYSDVGAGNGTAQITRQVKG